MMIEVVSREFIQGSADVRDTHRAFTARVISYGAGEARSDYQVYQMAVWTSCRGPKANHHSQKRLRPGQK